LQAAADTVIAAAACEACVAYAEVENDCILHARALKRLCRTAGEAALTSPGLASRLVSIPNPAPDVITTLVNDGVRVPFEKVVSTGTAASSSTGRCMAEECSQFTQFLHVCVVDTVFASEFQQAQYPTCVFVVTTPIEHGVCRQTWQHYSTCAA
jgi:hypothetical protein